MRVLTILVLLVLGCSTVAAASCTTAPNYTGAQWSSWGNGLANSRYTAQGLDSRDVATLTLRWAFAFPNVTSVVGNPTVQGSVVFIGVDSGEVYALDLDTACVYWTFKAEGGVRTAPAVANVNGKFVAYFGDRNTNVYAVDASTGQLRWKTKVETHPAAILTGSPQFVQLADASPSLRLIVPVSSSEEGLGAVPNYNCCSFRGSVVSLDAVTGDKLWQSYPIQTATKSTGANSQGPSGAGIWSAPTIDVANKRLYVATGDAYSAPADIATDAIVGMELESGRLVWTNQGTAGDVWTAACLGPNASKSCGPDQDYGSPAMLVGSTGKQYLVAGQKSGWIRAFNLAGGSSLWNTAVVENTREFGGKVIWGGANDGRNAYFGLGSGGVVAVRLEDGSKQWFTELKPVVEQAKHPGQDGPLVVSQDVLFTGGWDGTLRAISTADGKLLKQIDTAKDYTGVNGIPGKGGSMGAAGPVVAGKHLLVPSGYVGVKNGIPGNVLLMFTP